MSVQETIKKMLVERGMSEIQADEIILSMKKDPANQFMQGRWQDDISSYPKELLSLLIMYI